MMSGGDSSIVSPADRIRPPRVAVRKLDGAFGPLHERVVHVLLHQRRAHRDGAVGQALGAGDDVWLDAEEGRREGAVDAPERADHLIENQQDAVLGRDLAQLFQVALGRDQHARGAGHRFDDDGGDGGGVMQRDDAFQLVGQVGAPGGLALGVGVLFQVMGMRQVVYGGQQRAGERLTPRSRPIRRVRWPSPRARW
ncbi:hypothetical protein G6F50_014155 [Rhizopus delemar]|uniref:Uncharacterized protein n=1 Tax=Rhizopus delemar TaxID=936053 RepID=A0A9P6Y8G1_9FUNG|nr:hypothetical protein G6F50_014155 [Rhizopus delemar]